MRIYPNPTSDNLKIAILSDGAKIDLIEITDISGKLVRTLYSDKVSSIMDIQLPPQSGIYIIKLIANGIVTTSKVIKI